MRRHIAHASKVLSMPVTMVKMPIMRFTFVSIDSDKAVAEGSARLSLNSSVGYDWYNAHPFQELIGAFEKAEEMS